MPTIAIGDTVAICDATKEHIGDFRVDESRYGAWCGKFRPMPAYERVRHLFREHAEQVATVSLRFIDQTEAKIAALGLWARIGSDRLEIYDVEIYEDADGIGGSFRQVA